MRDLGHWTTPDRPVPAYVIGSGDWPTIRLVLSPPLPKTIEVPVAFERAARFAVLDEPLAPPTQAISARAFRLRVTAADHLGPTEAEYREVER